MGKVITSQGLNEFVSTGKHETVENHKPEAKKEAPPLEVVKPPEAVEVKVEKPVAQEDDGLEADDLDLTEHVRKKIGKKHRAMKEAQERSEEAERFAENQYNRAQLAERKAAELEAKLSSQVKQPEKAEKSKPDPKLYVDDKGQFKAYEYAEDLAAYSAEKAVADDRQKQEEAKKAADAAAAQEIATKRVAESVKKHPDYHDRMEAANVKTHNAVLEYLTTSEHIGEVSYYLATNPEFVERINKLHPLKAIAEIGKLELSFEKPKVEAPSAPPEAPKASAAPAPITPLSPSSAVNTNTDPAKMSYKELRAYERARRKR